MNATPYIYTQPSTPWEAFRLIKLHPAPIHRDPLRFTLVEAKYDSCPKYTAISYTWGGQEKTQTAWCDDKAMPLTINAEDALRRLRPRRGTRHFWLDAICIDQSCEAEKSIQVGQMADVYRNAECVASWLGKSDKDDRLRAHWSRFLTSLSRHAATGNRSWWVPQEPSTGPILEAVLSELIAKDYWTRIWTIQEMAVNSSRMLYIDWHRPLPVQYLCQTHTNQLEMLVPFLQDVQTSPNSVDTLVDTLLQQNAAEPLDYVYGLRAVYPQLLDCICVDYGRAAGDLFTEASKQILLNGGWKLLFTCRHGAKRPDCPSWVPDWSSLEKRTWLLDRSPASLTTRARPKHQPTFDGYGTLVIRGVKVVSVVTASTNYLPHRPTCTRCAADAEFRFCTAHLRDFLGQWIRACRQLRPTRLGYDHGPEQLRPTIHHHMSMAELICSEAGPLPAIYLDDVHEHLETLYNETPAGPRPSGLYNQLEYLFRRWLSQRHFFLAEDGSMGIALLSSGLQAGDIVVKFHALDHFFALRPVMRGIYPRYEFFGWVHFENEPATGSGWEEEVMKIV